ncbi:hypothetical protein B0813_002887 [Candidatus Fervidibacteria bacterium JGI MDM2 SSWTFF-3-K9]
MRAIVMVEGDSDEVFFDRLLKLMALRRAVEIYQYAKVGYIEVIRTQLNLPGAQLILLRDLGSATEEGLRTEIDKNLQTIGKAEQVEVSRWRFGSGATLCLIPVGLPDDEDLKSLGIRRHELESHLLRYLFDHPEKCIHERTGRPITDPRKLLQEILPTIRQYDPPLDSAKDVFQVLRGALGWTGGPLDWIGKLLRDVKIECEPAFQALVERIKQALQRG